jgi:sporulation protein YlmC with PRC-barrel domain
MLEEVYNLQELKIYTQHGALVGQVTDVILDLTKKSIDGLFVELTNENLVEEGHSINVPFRWVQSVGDVIILKHFPERVSLTEEERKRLDALRRYQEMAYEQY